MIREILTRETVAVGAMLLMLAVVILV